MQNFIADAAGSLKQARTLVIQQVQLVKITTANYEEVRELLGYCSKLADLQATLEVVAHRFGDSENGLGAAAAAAGRMRSR